MKFSIVTISYNQAKFLEKAICSVLSQKGVDLEYIVVDPGSTDGSREIIRRYEDKITRVVLEKDAGAADGLNKGFSYATGDILGFVNSDDELLPGALEKIASAFKGNPRADAVSGCGYFVDASGKYLKSIQVSRLTPKLYVYGAITIFQQGTFFKREYFNRVNGFNVNNKTCWDGELFVDMAMAGARFDTIVDNVALFRLHDESISGSGRLGTEYAKDKNRIFEKVMGRRVSKNDHYMMLAAKLIKLVREPRYLVKYFKRMLATPAGMVNE